jgi:Mor family transcriptional regulator
VAISYGTLLNRLHGAGTVMRTSWQTRRLRQDPQARSRLAARLRVLYETQGATLDELARRAGKTKPATRRLLIEAGGEVRTTRQTREIRSAPSKAKRTKLALWLRAQYGADASVPELAKAWNFSVATVYRLLREARTPMRPQHRHDAARQPRKQR